MRRWIRRVTPELAPDLYELGFADALGKGRDATDELAKLERAPRARRRLDRRRRRALDARTSRSTATISMRELGLPPGRIIGEILEHLVEIVTDDPSANEPARLLEAARAFLAKAAGLIAAS